MSYEATTQPGDVRTRANTVLFLMDTDEETRTSIVEEEVVRINDGVDTERKLRDKDVFDEGPHDDADEFSLIGGGTMTYGALVNAVKSWARFVGESHKGGGE